MSRFIEFMGFPVLGINPDLQDGIHKIPCATFRGSVIIPCYIRIEQGEITAYGQQTHCWIWEVGPKREAQNG